jgi:hypothetical protein
MMDTTEILSRAMLHGNPGKLIENFYTMLQQNAAQLAAIRELMEAEQGRLTAQRRREAGWPPRGSEPLSHIS